MLFDVVVFLFMFFLEVFLYLLSTLIIYRFGRLLL